MHGNTTSNDLSKISGIETRRKLHSSRTANLQNMQKSARDRQKLGLKSVFTSTSLSFPSLHAQRLDTR